MDMRFDRILDAHAIASGQLEVDLDITARIDDRRDTCLPVAYQVGDLGEALGIDGFEEEWHSCTPP
jgi:hypothetical protein